MAHAHRITLAQELAQLTFLAARTPHTSAAESANAFAELAEFGQGAIFVAHFAGRSEWERHPAGDELVLVVEGATTLTLLLPDERRECQLAAGELVVVPRGTWHRFEVPEGVKLLTVTPQPTDHSSEDPAQA